MKALKGGYFFRAKKAIEAGCKIVLHCEPNLEYMIKSTLGAGKVSEELKKKTIKVVFIYKILLFNVYLVIN